MRKWYARASAVLLIVLLISGMGASTLQPVKHHSVPGTPHLSDGRRATHDVGATAFGPLPSNPGPNSSIEIGVYITNYGSSDEINVTVNVTYVHESLGVLGYSEGNISYIASGTTEYIILDVLYIPTFAVGNVTITAETRLPGDEDGSNNQTQTTVWIRALPDLCLESFNSPTPSDRYSVGDTVLVSVVVGNPGNMDQHNIEVSLLVYTDSPYTEVLNTSSIIDNISAFGNISIDIASFTVESNATHHINVTVHPTPDGDIQMGNNTLTTSVSVEDLTIDIGATDLSMYPAPTDGMYSPDTIVNMGVYVTNYGDVTVDDAPFYISIIGPSGSEVFNSSGSIYSLAPSATQLFSAPTSWTVPSTEGTYTVRGILDYSDDVVANNVITTDVSVGVYTDASLDSITLSPEPSPSYVGGESVNITVSVSNAGMADITIDSVSVSITGPDGGGVYTDSVSSVDLAGLQFLDIQMGTWTVPEIEGNYTISAALSMVGDENASNNNRDITVRVGSVIDVSLVSLNLTPQKSVYSVGEAVTFSARVSNLGSVPATPTLWLNVTHSSALMYSYSINGTLDEGDSGLFTLPASFQFTQAGDYEIMGELHLPGDMVPGNNIMYTNVTVVSPDVDVGIVSITPFDGSTQRSGEVTLGADVKNYAYVNTSADVSISLYNLGTDYGTALREDAESEGGMATSIESGSDFWHRTNASSSEGDYSWWFGDESTGSYPSGSTVILHTGPVDLTSAMYAVLEFDTKYNLVTLQDYGYVVVSTDGSDWTSAPLWTYTGSADYWQHQSIGLSSYVGSTVYIGFMISSASSDKNGASGWFLDNITVKTYQGSMEWNETYTIVFGSLETVPVEATRTLDVGQYILSVSVHNASDINPDNDNATAFFTLFEAQEINNPPIANIYSPGMGSVFHTQVPVHFSAEGSYDPDNDPLSYKWSIGEIVVAEKMEFEYTFSKPGTYTVTLEVSDIYGGSDTASIYVNIIEEGTNQTGSGGYKITTYIENYVTVSVHHMDNVTPEISINFGHPFDPQTLNQSLYMRYVDWNIYFSISMDIKDDLWDWAKVVVDYSWNAELSAISDPGLAPRLYSSSDGIGWWPAQQEMDISAKLIKANVTSLASTFAVFTPYVMPPNTAPVPAINASATNITSGDVVVFNASTSYDSDGSIIDYSWDFGDGTQANGPVVTHKFVNTGTSPKIFTVVLTVKDDGFSVNSTSIRITVNPAEEGGNGGDDNGEGGGGEGSNSGTTSASASVPWTGIVIVVVLIMIAAAGYIILRTRHERSVMFEFEEEEEEEEASPVTPGKGVPPSTEEEDEE